VWATAAQCNEKPRPLKAFIRGILKTQSWENCPTRCRAIFLYLKNLKTQKQI